MQVIVTVNDMPNEPMPIPPSRDPGLPPIPIPTPVTPDKQFKRESRKEALTIAMQNKPSPYYDTTLNKLVIPSYNLLDESEKIYQWLIKDL